MTQQKKRHVFGIALFLSLLGNMFFVGLWVGTSLQQNIETSANIYGSTTEYQASQFTDIDTELREHLQQRDENILRDEMKGARSKIEIQKQNVRDAHKAVRAAMYAEPFDQNALDLALANERDARQSMHTLINATRRNMASKLSPEGRKALAEMEERVIKRRSHNNARHEKHGMERLKKYKDMRKRRNETDTPEIE